MFTLNHNQYICIKRQWWDVLKTFQSVLINCDATNKPKPQCFELILKMDKPKIQPYEF